MSELGDRIGEQLGGEPDSLAEAVAELFDVAGSGRKAAALIGVNESVFRRLRSGATRKPKEGTVDKIMRAVRSVRMQDHPQPLELRIIADGRLRVLGHGAFILRPGGEQAVRDAYATGGQEAAAKMFIDKLSDQWYRDVVRDINEPEGDDSSFANEYQWNFV